MKPKPPFNTVVPESIGEPGYEVSLQKNSGFAAEVYQQLSKIGLTFTPSYVSSIRKAIRSSEWITPRHRARFGGFCALTYLSLFSEGITEVSITGGRAPLIDEPVAVYAALIPLIVERNKFYYEKYPRDVRRVRKNMAYLESNEVVLPNGGRPTPQRWQQLETDFPLTKFVFRASRELEKIGNIAYKTLQRASRWAADSILSQHARFSWSHVNLKAQGENESIYFTGEMIFPSMFGDHVNLCPWKRAPHLLTQGTAWAPTYDPKRLSENNVKVSAAMYFNDMFVEFKFPQETAFKDTEQYIAKQLFHDGLWIESRDVMKHLFQLSKREYN